MAVLFVLVVAAAAAATAPPAKLFELSWFGLAGDRGWGLEEAGKEWSRVGEVATRCSGDSSLAAGAGEEEGDVQVLYIGRASLVGEEGWGLQEGEMGLSWCAGASGLDDLLLIFGQSGVADYLN